MLPVAELHIHIEGTLEPELMFALAGATAPGCRPRRRTSCGLVPFRQPAVLPRHLLRSLRAADRAGLLRPGPRLPGPGRGGRGAPAEIFFDPQTHLANGVPLATVFGGLTAALADGAAEHGISADLILCFLRHLGAEAADAMLRASLPFRDSFIGVGLDSTEVGPPAGEVHGGVRAGGGRRPPAGGACGRGGRPRVRARRARPAPGRAHRPRRAVRGRPRSGGQAARSSRCR